MMEAWQSAFIEEWRRRSEAEAKSQFRPAFPLTEQNFEARDIAAMAEVLLSGQLTMSAKVREFEKQFAAYVGAPFAVMVNSGSSANLLALAVATNPMRKQRLCAGDEILVPAVCWSTSVWPLIQLGLKPIFVDVDPNTLNVDVSCLKEKITPRTRGLMAVHILGNCAPMDEVLSLARDHNWIVVEDTCESFGVKWQKKVLGTLGDFGTYSFYFSHHMTTGEGGMVTCKTQEDYDLLKCLRAHGWTRELSNRAELEQKYNHVDPRFLFVNVGYNLRPMEIQAALGLEQLNRITEMNQNRIQNWQALVQTLKSHPKWRNQFTFPIAPSGAEPVWFGFPALLSEDVKISLRDYLTGLSDRGVENRPIVSGNFARQPGLEVFDCRVDWKTFVGAERVHHRGFFIGSHAQLLTKDRLNDLADRLLAF